MSWLSRIRAANGDPEKLAAIHDEMVRLRVRVGDRFWAGAVCLECVEVDEHGSTLTREIARAVASVDGDDDWHWTCPTCGASCHAHGIHVRDDPRCFRCRATERFEDLCPPTLRDPGLPPTARDGCAGAAGDAIEE